MKPEWTRRAFRELRAIEDYLAEASTREVGWAVIQRILKAVDLLETNPYMGRQSEWRGRRELVAGPYVVLYSVHRSGVKVIAVTHGAGRK